MSIDAHDVEPPDAAQNPSFPSVRGQRGEWHKVGSLEEFEKRKENQADSVLFLCWPPAWGSDMASKALINFEESGGTDLIFIGEPQGGKTGDERFFELLSQGWKVHHQEHDRAAPEVGGADDRGSGASVPACTWRNRAL
ncbi:hypothetical protein AB0F52_47590 [Amycolatopsis sp. NPDC024027]|uniref:hypothetical protein n=1 Tax=Amycolatopsis sp. NPDC024027 TaxID=3154327 RepID=UPI0033CF157A